MKNYFLWSVFFVILIFIIKDLISLIKSPKEKYEHADPQDLIPDERFCPQCGKSFKKEVAICPQCSVTTSDFEEIEYSGDFTPQEPDPDIQFVKIFFPRSLAESRVILMKLKEENIDCVIEESGDSILPLGETSRTPNAILVPQNQQQQAKQIITDFLNNYNEEQ